MTSFNQHRASLEPIDVENPSNFDLEMFSRFKHGAGPEAAEYGQALADFVVAHHPEFTDNALITGSCFKHTPVASHYLALETQLALNHHLMTRDDAPVSHLKLDRAELFDGDYSAMTIQERQRLLSIDTISMDLGRLVGKRLIVVDDVRITGGHERKIADLLDTSEVEEVLFLYVAELLGDTSDPTIEDRLNRSTITNPGDLIPLFSEPGFKLNSRVVKFVIGRFDAADRTELIQSLDQESRRELWAAVMHNGYYQMPKYADAARQLYLAVEPPTAFRDEPFDADRYSRMKYGSVEAARYYGSALFDQLERENSVLIMSDKLVLSPGATSQTPKAAHAICDELLYRVNIRRYERGLNPARQIELYSSNLAAGDYGLLTQAEREARHARSSISTDIAPLYGADVIVIDDISISGQTAKVMDRVFAELPVKSYRQMFAANIDPVLARQNPAIEADINHATVRTLADLSELANQEPVAINQRVAKFVLAGSNLPELSKFIESAPSSLIASIERAALLDGMYRMPEYRAALNSIKNRSRSTI